MYTDAELSQRKIDRLLELWTATLICHGDSPPITNYRDLHLQIDAIDLGGVPWEHASLKYNGPPPKQLALRNGRPWSMTFGSGTLAT